MLRWPHSSFHVHVGVGVPEDKRALARRLAHFGARAPVPLERMSNEAESERVTYRSEKAAGPTAGTKTGGSAGVLPPPGHPHSPVGQYTVKVRRKIFNCNVLRCFDYAWNPGEYEVYYSN